MLLWWIRTSAHIIPPPLPSGIFCSAPPCMSRRLLFSVAHRSATETGMPTLRGVSCPSTTPAFAPSGRVPVRSRWSSGVFVMAFAWNAPACGQTHVDPGEAAILVKCRWTGPADRTVTFQFDEGVVFCRPFNRRIENFSPPPPISRSQPMGFVFCRLLQTPIFLVELRCSVNGPGSLSISVDQAGSGTGIEKTPFRGSVEAAHGTEIRR